MLRERRRPPKWSKLDNAAKIFPPTSYGADTGVFRMSCELVAPVQPVLLQQALDRTLTRFPHLLMVMRRGIFWYYLEQTTERPQVEPETLPPCARLYKGGRTLLLRVSYWKNKVNVEIYHVLADGSGAIDFFSALITAYLRLCYPACVDEDMTRPSVSQRGADSFQKYYLPHLDTSSPKIPRAFHIRGSKRPSGGLNVIEGVASTAQVLEAAHKYGATLTGYLAAVLVAAIHEEMYVRDEKKPVVVMIPVDLRKYFPSRTARNFFGTVRVGYNFSVQPAELGAIATHFADELKKILTPEHLRKRMNRMTALERNVFLRPVPLAIKDFVMRISGDIAEKRETVVLSNTGKFPLPPGLQPFVTGFSTFMATHSTQLCVCSCGNQLHLDFTSALECPEVQRRFFTKLVEEGIEVEIRSNEFHEKEAWLCSDVPVVE